MDVKSNYRERGDTLNNAEKIKKASFNTKTSILTTLVNQGEVALFNCPKLKVLKVRKVANELSEVSVKPRAA